MFVTTDAESSGDRNFPRRSLPNAHGVEFAFDEQCDSVGRESVVIEKACLSPCVHFMIFFLEPVPVGRQGDGVIMEPVIGRNNKSARRKRDVAFIAVDAAGRVKPTREIPATEVLKSIDKKPALLPGRNFIEELLSVSDVVFNERSFFGLRLLRLEGRLKRGRAVQRIIADMISPDSKNCAHVVEVVEVEIAKVGNDFKNIAAEASALAVIKPPVAFEVRLCGGGVFAFAVTADRADKLSLGIDLIALSREKK